MNRLYRDSDFPGPLNAVAAVVDKLPSMRTGLGDTTEINDAVDASESEGVSLLFVRPENVHGKPAPPLRIKEPETKEPALIFSVQNEALQTFGGATHRPMHEVGLRLANTIFVNGNENTLFGMRWSRDPASKNLVLDQSADLSVCVIASTANTVHNSLELPLHPVSQRRKVISSMGNILRQITGSTDDGSAKPMPASAELEKELPRYISENDIADPLVAVWALIEKPDVGSSTEANTQDHLANSLRRGGKLYRVMSGGGGWGKKQGLLSLDPDASLSDAANQGGLTTLNNVFRPNAPMQDSPPPLDKGLIIDDLSLLSQAASPGDYIQFFVSVEPDPSSILSESPHQHTRLSYRFGVAFDAGDYGEGGPANGPQKDLAVLPNYFGALSSKTISYLQPLVKANSTGEVLESSTKLDIPGSRVELLLK